MIESFLRLSRLRTGAAIVYHRVDDLEHDPGDYISPPLGVESFSAGARWLRDHFDIVPARELLVRVESRRKNGGIPIALTFDDDLSSHRRIAMPILQDLDVPATFFLSGASLDRPSSYWWERLERAARLGIDPRELVSRIAPELNASADAGRRPTLQTVGRKIANASPDVRLAFSERLGELVGPDPPDAGLRTDDIRAIAAAGFEVGFHTRDHHVLPALEDADLRRAITAGRTELERVVGRSLESIAYPHGKADARVASVARAAGFVTGFVARNGGVRPGADPLLLDRVVAPPGGQRSLRRHVLDGLRIATLP